MKPRPPENPPANIVRTGLELFCEDPRGHLAPGKKAALLYNAASIAPDLRIARDKIHTVLGCDLVSLFGPQHGVNSDVQDNMIETGHGTDPRLGLPVWSLYGETRKPTPRMLKGVDALLVDLPDVGTRVYTFIWTLRLAMEVCAQVGVRVIVLDRPNPIGGAAEGNLLEPAVRSFVGLEPIPMRHGLTVGELARCFNQICNLGCDLTVVKASGWERWMHHTDTQLPWAMPSPNMPAYDTALVYPGTVLLEGTNASEGRGTTRPFELIGTPWGRPEELGDELNGLNLPGVHFRPVVFMPTFHKWAGRDVNGVFIHVTDRESFKPYLTGVAILSTLWRLYRDKGFAWRDPPYEYELVELPINLLLGSRSVREGIEAGASLAELEKSWQAELDGWNEEKKNWRLY